MKPISLFRFAMVLVCVGVTLRNKLRVLCFAGD